MITPRSLSSRGSKLIISDLTNRIRLKDPIKFISITRRKFSNGIGPVLPTIRSAGPIPAQFINTLAGPCFSRATPIALSPDFFI